MSKLPNLQALIVDGYELGLKAVAVVGIAITLPLMLALTGVAALLILPLVPFITKDLNQGNN